jgi:hypothetical protein
LTAIKLQSGTPAGQITELGTILIFQNCSRDSIAIAISYTGTRTPIPCIYKNAILPIIQKRTVIDADADITTNTTNTKKRARLRDRTATDVLPRKPLKSKPKMATMVDCHEIG